MPPPAVVWMPGSLKVEVLLRSEDTGGAFCMLADHPQPGWALPPHSHGAESETIYVVAGRFDMVIGGEALQLGPGDVAHVPKGVTHSGAAAGDEPGHRVIVFSPAGMENFFLQAGAAQPGAEPDLQHLIETAVAHGWSFGE